MARRSHTPKGQLARSRILRAAEPLLAGRGFHGTSMRDVAEASGIPLASVVYHFAKKERLHAAVLEDIAAQLGAALERGVRSGGKEPSLEGAARALVRWSLRHPGRVRLLLRELLDNPARVMSARQLPLAPVLKALASVVGERGGVAQPELAVLHVIGAVSYVVAARPTVRRIVGPERDQQIMTAYEDEAVKLALQVFGGGAKEAQDGTAVPDRARAASARPPRDEDDGLGYGSDARDRGLRRRPAPRA